MSLSHNYDTELERDLNLTDDFENANNVPWDSRYDPRKITEEFEEGSSEEECRGT